MQNKNIFESEQTGELVYKLTQASNEMWSGVSNQDLLYYYFGLLLLLILFALFMRNKKSKPSKFQVLAILVLCSITLSLTVYVEGLFV